MEHPPSQIPLPDHAEREHRGLIHRLRHMVATNTITIRRSGLVASETAATTTPRRHLIVTGPTASFRRLRPTGSWCGFIGRSLVRLTTGISVPLEPPERHA
ncbi:MAG: hypothetical protein P1T08_09570 [Acidimicrobiia bacterium]|nr:hypothetical protein [Acidimicrobiia bacterium]